MGVHVPAHRWKSEFKERAGWHGCQMPEPLLGRIIRACSNPGELVLDPFGGSGTALVVAKKLRRRFPSSELSPDYVAAIRRRLDEARPGRALSGSPAPTAGGKGCGTRAKSR
jgi:site-specific DNA-methyltransferase (adenine-specific)